jgi:uncharacterized membrane protein YkgB
MLELGPSVAPFLFSLLLALLSPVTSRIWEREFRTDAEDLEDEGLISPDITDEFVNIARKIVGAVQMFTALTITAVSGGIQVIQAVENSWIGVTVNAVLVVISLGLLSRLFTRDPHVYSIFRGFPLTRSAVYTIFVNLLFLGTIQFL